jgi:hypothetical protein
VHDAELGLLQLLLEIARHEVLVQQAHPLEHLLGVRDLFRHVGQRRESLSGDAHTRRQQLHLGAVDALGLRQREAGRNRERVLLDQEQPARGIDECAHGDRAQRAARHEHQHLDRGVSERLLDRGDQPLIELLCGGPVSVGPGALEQAAELVHPRVEPGPIHPGDDPAQARLIAEDQLDAVGKDDRIDDQRPGNRLDQGPSLGVDALVVEVVAQLRGLELLQRASRLGEQCLELTAVRGRSTDRSGCRGATSSRALDPQPGTEGRVSKELTSAGSAT